MGSIAIEEQVHTAPMGVKGDQRSLITPAVTDVSALRAERVLLKIKDFSVHGFVSQESLVANFRNIQYARISARWQQAAPVDPTKEVGSIDATQWGPRCPQPVDVLHDATSHLYPRMSTFDRQSEFECLNLNVYGPMNALGKVGRGLPVLVWIHGGAFIYGDGGCEFDGQYLVRRSIEVGQPILVVGLNYRLGILGFLSSQELRAEARARGDVGFNNLGLHDQRIALQWVQKNIHHFGGDGSRITVAGESAGAISILAHLRGQAPVFQNAFIMSPATISPAPIEEGQTTFDWLVAAAGLSDAPAGQQLSALRSTSPMQLHDIVADRHNWLSADEDFFADMSGQRFEEISTMPSWVKGVVVGQTTEENVLFAQRWATMSADAMCTEWRSLYQDSAYAQELLSAYGINESSSQEDMVAGLVAYTSDVLFSKTTYGIATSHLQNSHPANPKVYLYSFDQPDIISRNPVFHGGAYHSQDNAFLFYYPQVADLSAPAEFRATADAYSSAALKLAYGMEPWEDISVRERFMSIYAEKSCLQEAGEGNEKRWKKLVDTKERLEMFLLGKQLLFKAMAYAMTLPINTHRQ